MDQWDEERLPSATVVLLCLAVNQRDDEPLDIHGVIDHFVKNEFPAELQEFRVFLRIADGLGRFPIAVEIQDLAADSVLARVDGGEIELRDAWSFETLSIVVEGLRVGKPGKYDVVVFTNEQQIGRSSFWVLTWDQYYADRSLR